MARAFLSFPPKISVFLPPKQARKSGLYRGGYAALPIGRGVGHKETNVSSTVSEPSGLVHVSLARYDRAELILNKAARESELPAESFGAGSFSLHSLACNGLFFGSSSKSSRLTFRASTELVLLMTT
jgi:hypothetical protein